MILIRCPLDHNGDRQPELERRIQGLMEDADYGLKYDSCGIVEPAAFEMAFEGDTPEDDKCFEQLFMVHGELTDLDSEITWYLEEPYEEG
jgi:hypothetical protein